MEGLLSTFDEGEWELNFLNDDAGFLMQLFNGEVGEGSGSSSVAPSPWSPLENHINLDEADRSFLHPMGSFYARSCHLSSHHGFNSQKEVGVVPSLNYEKHFMAESDYFPSVNNIGIPSELYTMDVDASPVTYFSNAMAFELGQVQPDIISPIPNRQLNLKRRAEMATLQQGQGDITSEIRKKKSRTTKEAHGNKAKKNCRIALGVSDDGAINNSSKQMPRSYSSEDDSNAPQELNSGTSSDPKLVASHDKNRSKKGQRGSAIDPQSLYARKRRERINQRLQILQKLIPNGTKVDISTMLEEAVSYVKFLQTQIKLLSSDDMWMYAPIAYNGVDIGLDRNISHKL